MADTNILGDTTVLTLALQDDGTVAVKQSDLAKILPKVDPSTGDWLIAGTDSGVKAKAPTLTVNSTTGHLMIDGQDSGVNVVGPQGIQGPNGDSAVSFAIGAVTAGSTAAVTDSVSGTAHTLNFTLPQPDMSAYTNTADLTTLLAGKLDKTSLTSYYTSAQMDTKLSAKADLAMVANIADKDTVQSFSNKVDQLTALVNSQDQTIAGLQTQLNTALAQIKTLVSQSNTTTTPKS